MAELLVLIPSRGRPGNLRKVISAWDFTNAWDLADMAVIVDADDPEIQGYREVAAETEHPDTGQPLVRLIEMATWMPMVHKLNMVAKDMAEGWGTEEPYWALAFAGDDHLPQTINWAKVYLDELHALGSGMVFGDDGYQGSNLSTEWAMTADAVRALGRMVPAPVEHMYCDNSIMELFDAAGALVHLPQVRIEHMHPIAKKAATDEQYQRVNSREQFARDKLAYDRWVKDDKAAQVAVIKALHPDRPVRHRVRKERPKMVRSVNVFPSSFKQVKSLTPPDVELALADFASAVPADEVIVELGVYHGHSALVMAWGAKQGNGARVWGIDPWDTEGNVYGEEFGLASARAWARYWAKGLGFANHVSLVQGFSHEVGADWSGPPVGLLFVDGDHTEEGARRDLVTWLPHLAPGAVIAVDDYVSPDYPGVAAAVDALVAEGVLAPVDVFHDRMAVTRVATKGDPSPAAITGEGVSPSPYLAVSGQVAVEPDRAVLETEWERVDPEGVAALRESAAALDTPVSSEEPPLRAIVQEDELVDVEAGTPVAELTIPQMKTLAKVRGIVLGVRKDKRAEIVQALQDGR